MSSSSDWPCAALPEAELAPRTTLRVGGRAAWLLEPANPDELRAAWLRARERGLPVRVLGSGANLLIADGTLPGVVIATDRLKRSFRPPEAGMSGEELFTITDPALAVSDRREDPRLVVWCGASLPGLVRQAAELGWAGLEGLAGVPAHLGGAVAMNAGGGPGWMWDVVESVRVLDEDGSFRQLERAECAPRYRDGNLGGRVVVGAVLRLAVDTPAAVDERTREYLRQKNATQPVSARSAGCVFKNPDPEVSEGRSAGKLVEDCGFKGRRVGGALVSPLHGNFIVNRGGATAGEVLELVERVREGVFEEVGVLLELEVKVWIGIAAGV